MKTKPSTCHSLEGPRLHTSQNQKCAPARSNKVRRSLPQKNYQNTQNNAPKRYAHTVGNRCDSAKCCVAAVYTYKYNINTILSRAIQQRYSQFEGLGKKGRITWPHGGTHLQNEAGAFHAPSVQPDPDPLHCSELISGTKALQFVTFWNFLSLIENTGEHRSKGIDHIYGVQNWWSEWSQTSIFHSWTSSFSAWYWPLYMASMQNWHFWRSEKSSI